MSASLASSLEQAGEGSREPFMPTVSLTPDALVKVAGGEVVTWAECQRRLAASTPVGGWEDISTAPKDGTMIITWCVHANAEHCEDAVADGYAGPVLAKWIDHNGGGFTWHGLAGQHTHWMPLPPPPSVSTDKGSRPQEAVPTEQAAPPVVVHRDQLETLRRSLELGNLLPGEGETLINCWIFASEAESKA